MKKSINLNPKKLNKEEKNNDILILSIVIIVAVCTLAIYTGNKALKLYDLKNKESILQSNVNNFQTGNLNTNLNNELNEKNEKIKILEDSIKSYESYKYINGISNAFVSGIEIDSISFNKGVLNIEGMTKNESLVGEFVQNLQKNELYNNVQLNLINKITKDKESGYNFTVSLNGGSYGE